MAGIARGLQRVHLAAVEDTAAQLTFWAPPGEIELRRPGRSETLCHPGGPGAVELDGLTPATTVEVVLRRETVTATIAVRTLTTPPGAALCRVATVSDLHLGAESHGIAGGLRERFPRGDHGGSLLGDPAPVRCARGALVAAGRWGAEALVGKGDLTHHGRPEEWQQLGRLLAEHAGSMTCVGVPGNHDKPLIDDRGRLPAMRDAGLRTADVEILDLDGARIIAFDSAEAGHRLGTVARHAATVVDAAAEARRDGRAVLVFLHHPLERSPVRKPHTRGVAWSHGRRFAADLARANPRALLSAGHTHRNRRRDIGTVVHTEVGSTKDWPGVWGGYAVHEGGIRQVVRRITAADAIGWIDDSRWAAAGLWWPYSPGRLADRCFTHDWPTGPGR